MSNKIIADSKWKKPRNTIACKFKKNDFGYVTHGSMAGVSVYSAFDLKPSESKNFTILDYGCGTGREARVLSNLFKHIHAFDPTPECLDLFKREIKLCQREFNNISLYADIDKVPICDYSYSMHVMEHLPDNQAQILMNNLKQKTRIATLLCYSKRNCQIVEPHLSPEQLENERERNREKGKGLRIRLIKFAP